MSHDVAYMAKFVREKLVGAKVVGVATDSSYDPPSFGLIMESEAHGEFIVWVQSDAEGNDSGWLQVDDPPWTEGS